MGTALCEQHGHTYRPYAFDAADQWCPGCLTPRGTVMAWRMWMTGPSLDAPPDFLYGPGGHGGWHAPWQTNAMRATCPVHDELPSMDHSDGIHGSWTLAELLGHPDVSRDLLAHPEYAANLVFGRVELSGRLRPGVEKARVIRGERGRMVGPLWLCGDRKLSGPLVARYRVKVVPGRLRVDGGRLELTGPGLPSVA